MSDETLLTQSIASGEINELIARNARVAYEQGVSRERDRIVTLLQPFAECDKELCGTDGKDHYGLDCDAYTYHHVIQQILKTDNQENTK